MDRNIWLILVEEYNSCFLLKIDRKDDNKVFFLLFVLC